MFKWGMAFTIAVVTAMALCFHSCSSSNDSRPLIQLTGHAV